MERPEVRFVLTATALVDRRVGLEWEPHPSTIPVTWAEAVISATDRGWRVPSAAELMGFLGDVPADASFLPPPGATLWSVTSSPFARPDRVRAVTREADGRFAVVLLHRDDQALCWSVRNAQPVGFLWPRLNDVQSD